MHTQQHPAAMSWKEEFGLSCVLTEKGENECTHVSEGAQGWFSWKLVNTSRLAYHIKYRDLSAGEMAQRLRAMAAFAPDPGSIPSTHKADPSVTPSSFHNQQEAETPLETRADPI